jgi:NADPH2:quinone reductase
VRDETGAALGIPGITAHRAVFADGPVSGRVVLVHGVLGAVSSVAAQLAEWAGATVIGTVRRTADLARAPSNVDWDLVALDQPGAAQRIRALAPLGVDRIVEVALSANADLDNEVIGQAGVIAAYATLDERPALPFWPLLFNNVTIRLLGSDDFPKQAKENAARDLSEAAKTGALDIRIGATYPLDQIAAAHQAVESGTVDGRVLVKI